VDLTTALIDGFLGAIAGGSLVAANDWRLQHAQNRREERSAGAMICLELSQNYWHMENLEAFAREGKAEVCRDLYSDRAWQAHQVKLAALLAPDDLNIVFRAYLRPPAIFAAVVPLETPKLVSEFFDSTPVRHAFIADALADIEEAVRRLDPAVFPRGRIQFWTHRRPQLVKVFYDQLRIQKEGKALPDNE